MGKTKKQEGKRVRQQHGITSAHGSPPVGITKSKVDERRLFLAARAAEHLAQNAPTAQGREESTNEEERGAAPAPVETFESVACELLAINVQPKRSPAAATEHLNAVQADEVGDLDLTSTPAPAKRNMNRKVAARLKRRQQRTRTKHAQKRRKASRRT
eukprot:CAMPEP_0206051884 /NCGR_PEP_ID=MMETSP1466-20131121/32516_1 /ASSEMBLY_ACC=CAM_ASM_001126 /TAXON_ID=44452 /ORGANISM="Pavlova gyrans, Strain CCMP608" /LENGTH=157 /DNA_ID=CAMNT_0053427017 /DNA_START=1 /DNA_END=474 /DNA_ORIENTATION=-